VDVEQHDVGAMLGDRGDRGVDVLGLGNDLHTLTALELGAHPGAEHGVVVDEDDPERAHAGAS
jgi:hypothetical protein